MGKDAARTGRVGWMLGATLAAMVPLVIVGLMLCMSAWAGEYHVYSCRTPDGATAPVDGWGESTKGSTLKSPVDECASGGGLVAALGLGKHAADKDLATWSFGAPAGETLGSATLWRAGDALGGANAEAESSYMFWLAGVANSGSSTQVFQECAALNGCSSEGNFTNPLAANNRVEVPERALHSPYLYLTASCGSTIFGAECPGNKGDENGNAAIVELFAADLVLNQESAPTVKEVSGSLAEGSTVSGTADVAFTAGDAGSGVYEVLFQVDGETVHHQVLSSNGGKCANVGETTDGLPAFLYTQPCPATVSVDVPFDTTGLSDGSHHIVVSVTDAAGNSTPVMDRQVTVANHPSSGQNSGEGSNSSGSGTGTNGNGGSTGSSGTGAGQSGTGGQNGASAASAGAATASAQPASRGAANGSNASDQATLSAHWQGGGVHLSSTYGKAHTLEGRLTAPGGAAIAGASIDVGEVPASTGAHAAGLPAARTDANGRFTLRLPGALVSGAVRLGYRSHVADTVPVATATLTLAVRVDAQLRVSPKLSAAGSTIHFTGRLLGGQIPAGGKQLVLEARSPGTRWLQFDVIRTSANGSFSAGYRFRLPGPVPYRFRVVSTYEADYPFLAGTSNTVAVMER